MRRILFQETDFNTLPNPPAGFRYIGFNGEIFSQESSDGIITSNLGGATGPAGEMGATGPAGEMGATGPAGSGGTSTVNDVTYSDLVNLINLGELSPGSFYKITDFRTCYEQPNYNWDGDYIWDNNYKQGDVYPLIVMATSETTLSQDAYQPDFPNDKIKYDISFTHTKAWWNNIDPIGGTAYGRIIERIDDKNNRTDFDHREVLYVRYKNYTYSLTSPLTGTVSIGTPTGLLIPVTGYNTSFTSLNVDDIIAIPDLQGKIFMIDSIDSDTSMIIKSDVAGYLSPSEDMLFYSTIDEGYTSYCQSPIQSFTSESQEYHLFTSDENNKNNYFGNVFNVSYWEESYFDLPNVVLQDESINNKFGDYCVNNTFGKTVRNNNVDSHFARNRINSDFQDNKIGIDFRNNSIRGFMFSDNEVSNHFVSNYITSNSFSRNKIGFYFNGNIISGDISQNNIQDDFAGNYIYYTFQDNIIGNHFYENTIYNNFNKNKLLSFYNNTIGTFNQFGSYDFENNSIGNAFEGNHITKDFVKNYIDNSFKGNEVYEYFGYNKIGDNCMLNYFAGEVSQNIIAGWLWINIFDGYFAYNKIGISFSGNIIGDGFGYGGGYSRGNTIGNEFYDNTIGEYFYDNNIADRFQSNNISDYFQLNDIKANNINNINFKQYVGNIASYTNDNPSSTSDDTYTVYQTSTSGNGTYSAFVVGVSGGVVTSVDFYNSGYDYQIGDIITISADQFNGTSDLNITVSTISETPLVYDDVNCSILRSRSGANVITAIELETNSFYISPNINGPFDPSLLGYV